jgi:hypothetical protein
MKYTIGPIMSDKSCQENLNKLETQVGRIFINASTNASLHLQTQLL